MVIQWDDKELADSETSVADLCHRQMDSAIPPRMDHSLFNIGEPVF